MPYDGALDVEAYIDQGVVKNGWGKQRYSRAKPRIDRTFELLNSVEGGDTLRRIRQTDTTLVK